MDAGTGMPPEVVHLVVQIRATCKDTESSHYHHTIIVIIVITCCMHAHALDCEAAAATGWRPSVMPSPHAPPENRTSCQVARRAELKIWHTGGESSLPNRGEERRVTV